MRMRMLAWDTACCNYNLAVSRLSTCCLGVLIDISIHQQPLLGSIFLQMLIMVYHHASATLAPEAPCLCEL